MGLSSVAALAELPRLRSPWGGRTGDHEAGPDSRAARRYLLLFRFSLVNGAVAAFIAVAILLGWLNAMFQTDSYHIVKLICLVFIIGLHQCGGRVLQLSQELNDLARGRPAPGSRAAAYLESLENVNRDAHGLMAASLKLKLATRLAGIRYLANVLVLLGLIGTVLGFIVALSGISPSTAGDVSAIGPMVSALLEGMAIALYTTLAGSLLNIWLTLNYRLLEQGTVHYYTQLVELGARR